MSVELQHWKCAVCGENLTYVDEDAEIQHYTHFDITRSNKILEVDADYCIEEDKEASNLKMEMQLCEECFTKVLQESKTLGKLFFDGQQFIY
jgi:hypothetical protein